MPAPAYKRCKTCGEEKSADAFYSHASSRDGLGSSCKLCVRAKARAWQDAHPDRVHASRARHQQKINEKRRALGGRRLKTTTTQRLAENTDRSGDCWVWTASLNSMGYGLIWADGRSQLAHRASYEHNIGPIPKGMDLDHVCHNEDPECKGGPSCPHRACCNPAHLEPVSHIENCRRGSWPKLTVRQAAQIKRLCLDHWSRYCSRIWCWSRCREGDHCGQNVGRCGARSSPRRSLNAISYRQP